MIVINIVVISPLSAANLIQSAELNTGNTTHKAYKEEIEGYGDVRRQAGMLTSSLPWDTTGGWSQSAVTKFKRITSALTRPTCGDESDTIRHSIQNPMRTKYCGCKFGRGLDLRNCNYFKYGWWKM